jgi:arylsulfatase
MSRISRRDFLKTSAALAAGAALGGAARYLSLDASQNHDRPNILILVFDAMSARHLSLHGYARETTPNLNRFAERATVYHRHYSTGNFTTSGTASTLTGMYPWTHRAFNYRGMVGRDLIDRNLFRWIGDEYTRFAFTQNLWADILLSQFEADVNIHLPSDAYSQAVHSMLQPQDLPSDRSMAYYAFQDFLNLRVDDPHPYPGSLLVASADLARALTTDRKGISARYPRGLPTNYDYSYENASVLKGVAQMITGSLSQTAPYLAYFHLWSPHEPYAARSDFVGLFDGGLNPPRKPHHPLSAGKETDASLLQARREYDEFIADLDSEFGRLMSELEKSGALTSTYIVVTSDHGELFERGEVGHASALVYAPVTHIPLLISAPGQQTRSDIHAPTSNVDLLPTLLHLAGKEIPAWAEGRLLPGLGGGDDPERSIFALAAKDNPAFRSITRGTFVLVKGPYELFFFTGYSGHADFYELYDLQEDPDELQDLFSKDITTASQMKDELLEAIHAANSNFQKKSS